jgi:integrase
MTDTSALLIGFAGVFRRSEIVGLQIRDVQISDTGLIIALRGSKTDQEGASFTKGIPVGISDASCPKCALEAWLQLAGITSGPIFRPIDRWGHVGNRALSSLGVARAVKRALTALEVETTNYSGHSLRAGLVTAAAMAGVSERVIMQQTGHKNTEMLCRYTREGSLFRENAAAAVGLCTSISFHHDDARARKAARALERAVCAPSGVLTRFDAPPLVLRRVLGPVPESLNEIC